MDSSETSPARASSPSSSTDLATREHGVYRQIVESMADAVLALHPDGTLVAINRSAAELLGLPQSSVGSHFRDASMMPELVQAIEVALEGRTQTTEFEIRTPPATPRVLRVEALHQSGGLGATLFVHDISEIRRLERMRQDFVSNVSHELRTPVSIVRAHAETLQAGAIRNPHQAAQFLDAIARSAERLSTLVSDLLDLSRIETGNYHFRLEQLVFAQICACVSDAVAQAASQRQAVIDFDFPEGLAFVADAGALEQIMVNLVENAVKYGPEGGRVSVVAKVEGNFARIEICDRGPGIAEGHRSRVFERFYRVDPGRSRAAGGTGLGLSIVKHLAEAMGGGVGVAPRDDGGSIFWVRLPLRAPGAGV